MNNEMTVRPWIPENWTGNLVMTEAVPDLPIASSHNELIEGLIATAQTLRRRIDVTLGKLERDAWLRRQMCPGSGGAFIINFGEQTEIPKTHEIPHWTESYLKEFWRRQLFERLDTFQNKAHGYEELDDIKLPTDKAFKEAKDFIRLLPLATILAPKIYFPEDGEILFVWKRQEDKLHVDLGLYGDGKYSYLATNNNEEGLTEDEVDVKEGLSSKLLSMLAI